MDVLHLQPIGEIRSPFKTIEDMPIQPPGGDGGEGQVVVLPEYMDGLEDLEGFSHIYLIYRFHLSSGFRLRVKPFLDDHEHGLFATRAPRRPNPIGLSIVPLLRREGGVLYVGAIDVVDRTPLLDIKPYVPAFDTPKVTRVGWMEGKTGNLADIRSDGRFGTDNQ